VSKALEVVTSLERRRRWSAGEKERLGRLRRAVKGGAPTALDGVLSGRSPWAEGAPKHSDGKRLARSANQVSHKPARW
jgi:hypothetical protein